MTMKRPAPETAPAVLHDGWAGLPPGPAVMGVLNVTPDSFSDGGRFRDATEAIAAGVAQWESGAAIVDVGGESMRPHSAPTDPREERRRILPVVEGLARAGVRVSIDSRNADTMQAALDGGAAIVNDVSGLSHDPRSARIVARWACPVILMHMRGDAATMPTLAHYTSVVAEVVAELQERVDDAVSSGVNLKNIAVDPGIGFAKKAGQSVALLHGLQQFVDMSHCVVVGVSRKAFVGRLSGVASAENRSTGSIAAGLFALSRGASVLRVHDVVETVEAVRVWSALASGEGGF